MNVNGSYSARVIMTYASPSRSLSARKQRCGKLLSLALCWVGSVSILDRILGLEIS